MLDENEMPVLVNGDFVIAPAGEQQIRQIMKSTTGSYKHAPLVGIGITEELNGPNLNRMEGKIREQLKRAGFTVNSVMVGASTGSATGKEIIIDAE